MKNKKRNNLNKQAGFTLIELMITVAIVAVLAAIAVPSYVEQVRKGKRTDAKVELLKLAQMQESYYTQNMSYAQNLGNGVGGLGLGNNVKSEQDAYQITMTKLPNTCNGTSTRACTGFTLTATAIGGQASDTHCSRFTLSSTGKKGTVAGASSTQIKKCWK